MPAGVEEIRLRVVFKSWHISKAYMRDSELMLIPAYGDTSINLLREAQLASFLIMIKTA